MNDEKHKIESPIKDKSDLKDYVLAAMHGNGKYSAYDVVRWAMDIKAKVDEQASRLNDPQ